MITFPEKIEQYVKLVGEGKKHGEIAKIMHVKKGTVEGNYRSKALELTGLTSTQELALYAKQHGYGSVEPRGVSASQLTYSLRGPAMEPVRDFYRRLEIHYFCNKCDGCKSYEKYRVLVVNGNLEQHLEQWCPPDKDVRTLLGHLKKNKLIEVQENEDVYRITFSYLVPKDNEAC